MVNALFEERVKIGSLLLRDIQLARNRIRDQTYKLSTLSFYIGIIGRDLEYKGVLVGHTYLFCTSTTTTIA